MSAKAQHIRDRCKDPDTISLRRASLQRAKSVARRVQLRRGAQTAFSPALAPHVPSPMLLTAHGTAWHVAQSACLRGRTLYYGCDGTWMELLKEGGGVSVHALTRCWSARGSIGAVATLAPGGFRLKTDFFCTPPLLDGQVIEPFVSSSPSAERCDGGSTAAPSGGGQRQQTHSNLWFSAVGELHGSRGGRGLRPAALCVSQRAMPCGVDRRKGGYNELWTRSCNPITLQTGWLKSSYGGTGSLRVVLDQCIGHSF